jgi:hypothetical protein
MESDALQMANVQVQNQSHSSEGALSSLEEALSDRYAVMVQLQKGKGKGVQLLLPSVQAEIILTT